MRHQVHGKKFNRSVSHRKALYANLAQSLIEYERVTTTLAKAKAVRPVVEKLVTTAKVQSLAARRSIGSALPTETAAKKLYDVLGPRFESRPGGYTRIIKIGRRSGDGTEMAVIEFVELSKPSKAAPAKKATVKQAVKRSTRQEQKKPEVATVDEPAEESPAQEEKGS